MTRYSPPGGPRRFPAPGTNQGTAPQSRFLAAARTPAPRRLTIEQEREKLAQQAALVRRRVAEYQAAKRAREAAPPPAPAAQPGAPQKPLAKRVGRRISMWLAAPVLLLGMLGAIGAVFPVASQTGGNPAPRRELIDQLQRLIDVAREAGLTDAEIRQITIEDSAGNVINALEYLQAAEQQKQAELARRTAEENRVYLTPRDVFKELRQREREDLDQLKDTLPVERGRR